MFKIAGCQERWESVAVTKTRERINVAFGEAAQRLGVLAAPQGEGRRPGPLSWKERNEKAESSRRNPSLGGFVRGHRLEIFNYKEVGDRGGFRTRCVVTFPSSVLPASASMQAKLAGPYGDSWNPISSLFAGALALGLGSSVRPRPRSSERGFLGSRWVQLDDGDSDGFVVAGKFDWPKDMTPTYGSPEAMMTSLRTRALRDLLTVVEAPVPIGFLHLSGTEFRYTTRELKTGVELVALAKAAVGFAESLAE